MPEAPTVPPRVDYELTDLGRGLALLVTVVEIDGNLKRQFEGALPEKAPS